MRNAALVEIEASLGQVSWSINISSDKLQELSDFMIFPECVARGLLTAHPCSSLIKQNYANKITTNKHKHLSNQ